MTKLKNILFKIAFILLFIAVTFFSGYLVKSCEKKPQPSIISDTIVNIDTLRYKDTVFYPKPVEVIKPVFDSIIDTVYVINDYYTGKIYEYNFKDTNLTFKAGIMLHKNSLVYLIPEYEIYRKTTTITNNIEVVRPPAWFTPKYVIYKKGISSLQEEPQQGDVAGLYYAKLGRYGHTFFIDYWSKSNFCITNEGNSNEDGSREGNKVVKKKRLKSQISVVARYLPKHNRYIP